MRELIEKGAARECGDAETIESALKPRFRYGAFSCLLFTCAADRGDNKARGDSLTQQEMLRYVTRSISEQ
jgi:hypothetical protein